MGGWGVSEIEIEMWDEVAMPGRGERVRDLLKYAAGKYPGVDAREACESAAAATGAYSFRGYCTWGSKEERAAVDAAVDAAVEAAVAARRDGHFAVPGAAVGGSGGADGTRGGVGDNDRRGDGEGLNES